MEPSDADYPPKKSNIIYVYSCWDGATGKSVNCSFTQQIEGLVDPASDVANNGGHTHDYASHPAGKECLLPPGAAAFFPLLNCAPIADSVVGSTESAVGGLVLYPEAAVKHENPDVSGKVKISSSVTSPPGWYCVSGCYDANSWRYETTVDIGIEGLERLSNSPDGTYIKVRTADTRHTAANAYYGMPDTNVILGLVAVEYLNLTTTAQRSRLLSINDMSLPRGGRFDVNGNWARPHAEHRIGISADINRDGVFCDDDKELRKAVDNVIPSVGPRLVNPNVPGRTSSRLLCESEGRKHIDFD